LAIAVIGAIAVFVLHGQDFSSHKTTPSRAASVVEILLGCIVLFVFGRGLSVAGSGKAPSAETPKWVARLDQTHWLLATLVGSFMLTYSLTSAAAVEILKAHVSRGDAALAFTIFALASITTIGAPVVLVMVAPERSADRLAAWRRWLLGNSRTIGLVALMVIGAVLIGRGIPRSGRVTGRRLLHPVGTMRSRGARTMVSRGRHCQIGPEGSMDGFDVIIVGTGAGGGTLARHLAPSGKRILLLERGDWLPREPQNWLAQDVFVDNRYVSEDTWYDDQGKPFQPQIHYFVGGATKLYGAALYRLRAEDFGELQHHDGISPAWPISYDELEPYYSQAEQMYEVHGARGEDPTEPPASAPYPHPAVSHEPRIQQLSDQLTAAGYHPFHAPCGILLDEENMAYSRCVRCANCDGFPCVVHAKADAEVMGVRPALEHENVTLLRNAKAIKLETNPAGTAVTAVVVERDGATETFAGDLVVVACGAANTAKLLLESASDMHPNGPRQRLTTRSGGTSCSTTASPSWRSRVRRIRPSTRRRSG
jgi:hypothetical protein